MLTTTQQREVEIWLIRNQPQVQFMLQNNELKQLLYEVYAAGVESKEAIPVRKHVKDLIKDMEDEQQEMRNEDNLTDYSDLLIKNL